MKPDQTLKERFFQVVVTILILLTVSKIYAQDGQKQTDPNVASFEDVDLEREYKPSQTKSGVETQVSELKDMIRQKRLELEAWSDVVDDLNSMTAGIASLQTNLLDKWKEIDQLMSAPNPDYTLIYKKIQPLLTFFFPSFRYSYLRNDKTPSSISHFYREFGDKLAQIRIKLKVDDIYPTYNGDVIKKEDVDKYVKLKGLLTDQVYAQFKDEYQKLLTSEMTVVSTKESEVSNF